MLAGNFDVLSTKIFFAVAGAQHDPGRAAVLAMVLLGLTLRRVLPAAALARAAVVRDGQRQGRRRPARAAAARAVARVLLDRGRWIAFTLVCYAVILIGGFVSDIGRGDMTLTFAALGAGFGIEWGSRGLFFTGSAWNSLFTTIEVAAIAAPLTALVGLLSAYVITRHRFAGRRAFEFLTHGQFRGSRHGDRRVVHRRVQRGAARADRRHGDPRAVLRVPQHAGRRARGRGRARADRPDARRGVVDAARVDAAHAHRVVMPLLRPAILATLVFSFTHAMTAVSAVIFLATAKYNLATVYIINRVEAGEYPLAIVYSSVLIVVHAGRAARRAEAHRRGEARAARGGRAGDGTLRDRMDKAAGGVVFENVTKRYGDVTAVDDVSFDVAAGQLVTLLGPSGCGKTTTLRMVAGLEPVTSGRIFIGGKDVTLRAANERDVSMVFQSYALFPHMTVLENVCYGPMSMRMDKAKARELAHAKLAMLGLDRARGAAAVGAVRRPAAARRGGALAGARAGGAAVRRAAVQSRREAAPPRAPGDSRAAAVARRSP